MNVYTGDVSVGGPIEVRELAAMSISKLAVGDYNNNVYLLRCRASGEALLIDAAAEPDNIISLSGRGGDQAQTILTTHRHPDHWQALAEVVARTGARTLAGANDADAIPVPTDRPLRNGDTVHVGDVELTAIELRGHTPGSIALHYADPDGHGHLFTGDSLFPGGVGKTADAEKFNSLLDDVTERIFDVYDDDTWFYPGHGFDSTLGAERGQLAEWRQRGW
jgi:glyoxylase-like metal-dependent hydrolase (beta-lactamase superfamily II)